MPIIDSQIYPYEAQYAETAMAKHAELAAQRDRRREHRSDEQARHRRHAILISAFSMYRNDASYAVEACKAHRDRSALLKPLDVTDSAVADVVAEWKRTPGTAPAKEKPRHFSRPSRRRGDTRFQRHADGKTPTALARQHDRRGRPHWRAGDHLSRHCRRHRTAHGLCRAASRGVRFEPRIARA